ncbi:hypothetical protein F5Y19DRAFT_470291 [Xylariaceae sp. FL1651]|nr:hypothetical protein F5Y19DRAFT_470291 [Xylariaceae sp. FL1651]
MNLEAALPGITAASQNEVSGPTVAFWMVCFALNSMSQTSDSLYDSEHGSGWLVRTSPLLSFFDMIHSLAVWVSNHSTNPRQAATNVLLKCTTTTTTSYTHSSKAIKTLKDNARFCWLAFVLGVLPQFIKLFGSAGIPWAQICGAIYLFSWFSSSCS